MEIELRNNRQNVVRLNVTKAKLQHAKLPLPLEELDAALRYSNGDLRLEKLRARSGGTEIEAHGSALVPCVNDYFEAHVEFRHLDMAETLLAAMPEKVRTLYRLFQPKGLATFRADVARRAGSWATLASGEPSILQLFPERMGFTLTKFPYPLQNASGVVDTNLLTKLTRVDITGSAGNSPVVIQGTWQGDSKDGEGRFDIQANGISLDDTLVNALPALPQPPAGPAPPNLKKLAQSFNATGKADIKAHVRHEPGAAEFHNEYHVHFREAAIRWDPFPYPLENVSGYLDIYPKHWEFRDGRGTHKGGDVRVQGVSLNQQAHDGTANPGLVLEIVGRNIPVDEDLHQALGPLKSLSRSWEIFRPRGQLTFKAKVDHRTLAPEDADVNVEVRGPTIEPIFFPYALHGITGQFHYTKNKLAIRNAGARHNGTVLSLDKGTVDLHPGGGHFTDLAKLKIEALAVDNDLIQALPTRDLRSGATALKLHDPFRCETHLVVAQAAEPGSLPVIYWDGQAWLRNVKLCTGLEWGKVTGTIATQGRYDGKRLVRVNGNVLLDEATFLNQPFRGVQARLQIEEHAPEALLIRLKAPVFGGDITGDARVDFNSTLRYELNLTGSQLDLAQFGQHNLGSTSQLQGGASARLHLAGQGSNADTLDGNGSIDIPNGHLYNLPLLLDILKFLGLRWPDRTAFNELHASFGIHGRRVSMRKLEVLGSAISLTGQGEFNLDGTDVALDFYPGWPRLDQLLPAAVRQLPPAVSKNLLTIEMRGKVTANEKDRKFTLKPIPALADLPAQVRNRLTGSPENRDEQRMLSGLGADK